MDNQQQQQRLALIAAIFAQHEAQRLIGTLTSAAGPGIDSQLLHNIQPRSGIVADAAAVPPLTPPTIALGLGPLSTATSPWSNNLSLLHYLNAIATLSNASSPSPKPGNAVVEPAILPPVAVAQAAMVEAVSQAMRRHDSSDDVADSDRPNDDTIDDETVLDLSIGRNATVKVDTDVKMEAVLSRVTDGQQLHSSPLNSPGNSSVSSAGSSGVNSAKHVSASTKANANTTIDYTYDAFMASDGRSKARGADGIPRKHAGGSRYTCDKCSKSYATSSNLSRHKQTHKSLETGELRKCPHCDKAYVSMPALSMHVMTHDLKHKCPECGKAFSRPWLLQGHMRSHSGEKPYGCAHCGKSFADRSNLRAHMQTHSAKKAHKCDFCQKGFALKSYLSKHQEHSCPASPHKLHQQQQQQQRQHQSTSQSAILEAAKKRLFIDKTTADRNNMAATPNN